jgi:hypothetical protein
MAELPLRSRSLAAAPKDSSGKNTLDFWDKNTQVKGK